jgi:hypothetical protein
VCQVQALHLYAGRCSWFQCRGHALEARGVGCDRQASPGTQTHRSGQRGEGGTSGQPGEFNTLPGRTKRRRKYLTTNSPLKSPGLTRGYHGWFSRSEPRQKVPLISVGSQIRGAAQHPRGMDEGCGRAGARQKKQMRDGHRSCRWRNCGPGHCLAL